jgi:hypothetical protein
VWVNKAELRVTQVATLLNFFNSVPQEQLISLKDLTEAIRDLRDEMIRDYAWSKGVDLEAIVNDDPVSLRFVEPYRTINETWRTPDLVIDPVIEDIQAYRKRLEESVQYAARSKPKPLTNDALRDQTLIYIYSVGAALRSDRYASEAKAALAQSYLDFFDVILRDLVDQHDILSASEANFANGMALVAEVHTSKFDDALQRGEGLLLETQGCSAFSAAELVRAAAPSIADNAAKDRLLALGYRLFQKAEKDGMHDFTFYNNFGIAAANIGKFDEAHQWYKTALNFDGEHAWALLNEGALYEKQGDLVSAQLMYEKSLDGGFKVCELDQKIWKDIDSWDLAKLGVMGDRMRAVLPEGAFDRLMQMRTPTKVQCSVIAAVGGLLLVSMRN